MSDFKPVKIKKHTLPSERRLYLVRCAKASGEKRHADADRPLTGEGRKSLKKLCKLIKKNDVSPDLILCSPARRGRETLEGVLTVLDNAEIVFLESLYTGNEGDVRRFIDALPAKKRRVMIIGHAAMLKRLSGGGKKVKKLPKASLFCVKSAPGRFPSEQGGLV